MTRTTSNIEPIEYINFQDYVIVCSMCGEECEYKQSIPIDAETALVVSNDFIGKTGAVPVCRSCFAKHESGEFVGQDTRY